MTLYDCDGLYVAIPNEYIEQLLVVTDSEPEQSRLISVYEKQSYEDSRADFGKEATGGFLFSIARYTQAQYKQFLMSDGSGQSFFAKDDTYYYGWFVPTDVQFYRSEGLGPDSDAWKAWEELNERCSSIRDDFIERNHLAAYSDDEFWNKEFTYDSEHLYVTYYPYYAYQDTAKAQGFEWQDIAYTLVLSQPATQGDTGIWCVERWYDDDQYGYVYVYFPDADGVPAAEYYADEQAQRDAGHKVSAFDPEQVALEFVRQYFGHTDATFESITINDERIR